MLSPGRGQRRRAAGHTGLGDMVARTRVVAS
jgi:hypothetical protein